MIKHLKHKEIDKELWDRCIGEAKNRLIYAFSWYLDIITPQWNALVIDNYKAVMPLPCKSKFGVRYLYQPWLAQQLGFFTNNTDINYSDVLALIKKKYLFGHINFNANNKLRTINFKINQKTNLVLDLRFSYQEICAKYKQNHKRNISKAKKNALKINGNIKKDELFALFKKSGLEEKVGWKPEHLKSLSIVISVALQENNGELLGVYKDSELISAVFYLIDKSRITYIFPVSIESGYKYGAQFMLVDYIINRFAGQDILFDFEGSSIEGIAKFYRGFGARDEEYLSLFVRK